MSTRVEPIYLKEISKLRTSKEGWEPYPWYKEMRDTRPVYYDAEQDVWNVFLYEDVKRVLTDYDLFTSKRSRSFFPIAHSTDSKSNVNFSDPPVHTHRRAFLAKAFSPRNLVNWEVRIERIVNEMLDGLAGRKIIDILDDFAIPLPIIAMAELLGVPTQDRQLFKEWSTVMFLPHNKDAQQDVRERKQKVLQEFAGYLFPFVQAKRNHPSDDIISDLVQAESEGERLNDQEVLASAMALLGGGFEQTTNLLANSMYCFLCDNSDTYVELQKRPELISQAMEEVLRYRFPVCLDRQVVRDTNVFGHEMKQGQMVVAWVSSANRDERQFPHADQFDIHREGNKQHLSFGAGPHFCPGSALARLKVKTALTAFIQRYPNLQLQSSFDITEHLIESTIGQSLKSLPVSVQG